MRKLSAAILAVLSGAAQALPQGGQVIDGGAEFEQQGATFNVDQSTERVVIEYDSFNIDHDETVNFIQPSSDSVALNRVVGNDLSSIHGQINANGQVFLINPNGVIFGEGAQVNVGALVATTLDVDDRAFMDGDEQFTVDSQNSVQNHGSIRAQNRVWLAGAEVLNSGDIQVQAGDARLIGGQAVFVQPEGSSIALLVDDPDLLTQVHNTGSINAEDVALYVSGNEHSQLINQGQISAQRMDGSGGAIRLQASGDVINSGELNAGAQLDASGMQGGQVVIEANRIAHAGEIDVQGQSAAAGSVNLHAQNTLEMYDGATVKANAVDQGDGGQVILLSEQKTRFHQGAEITAEGGSQGGDGGFVEVSGRQYVDVQGRVEVGAQSGEAGTWYIDPTDITIANTSDAGGSFSGAAPFTWALNDPAPATSQISINTLRNTLVNGDVTVDTASAAGNEGDISWAANLNYDGLATGRTLTLIANRDINIQGGGTIYDANPGSEGLSVVLDAGRNIRFNGGSVFDVGLGTFSATAGGDLLISDIVSTSTADDAVRLESIAGQILDDGDPNTQISAANGGVFLRAAPGIGQGDVLEIDAMRYGVQMTDTADLNVDFGANDIELTSIGMGSNSNFTFTTTGNFTYTGSLAGDLDGVTGSQLNISAGGSIALNGNLGDQTGAVDNQVDLNFAAGTGLSVANGALIHAGSGIIDIDVTTGDASITGLASTNAGNNAITVRADAGQILDAGDSLIDLSAQSGGLVLSAMGSINNIETDASGFDLLSATGDIIINQSAGLSATRLDAAGAVTINSGGAIDLSNGLTLAATDLNLTSAAEIALPSNLNIAGNVALVATDISDNLGSRVISISASDLSLDSALTGGDLQVNTTVATLSARNSGANTLTIQETDAVSIVGLDVGAGGLSVSTGANEDLSISSAIDLDGNNGSISFNAGKDLLISADLRDSTGGVDNSSNIQLSAANDIIFAGGTVVDAGLGSVAATATAGDVQLSQLAGNLVSITAGGAIFDANGAAANIIANTANVNAAMGIATLADGLETQLANGAIVSSAGGAYLSNNQALSLSSVNLAGDLQLNNTGDLTFTQAAPTIAGQTQLVVSAGDLVVNDAGLSLSGPLVLQAQAIRDSDDTVTLAASNATITLANGGADTNINSSFDDLVLSVLGGQSLSVSDSDDLNVTSFDSQGNLTLASVAGNLSLNQSASNVAGDLSLQAANTLLLDAAGLTHAGRLNIDAQNLSDGDSSVSLQANQADIRLAGTQDTSIASNFASLALDWSGANLLSINEANDLDLTGLAGNADIDMALASGDLSVSATNFSHSGQLDLQTAGGGLLYIPETGLVTAGNLNINVDDIRDSDTSIILQAGRLDLNLRNAGELNVQSQVDQLALNNAGGSSLVWVDDDQIELLSLVSGGAVSVTATSANILASNLAPNVASTLSLITTGSGELVVADSGLSTGANLEIDVADIRDTNNDVSLTANNAVIRLRSAPSTSIRSNFVSLDIDQQGSGALNIVNASALDLVNLASSGALSISASDGDINVLDASPSAAASLSLATINSGAVVLNDSGLAISGDLNINADEIRDSDYDLNLAASAADINLRNPSAATILRTNVDDLSLATDSIADISVIEQDSLNLQSLGVIGAFSLTTASDLNISSALDLDGLSDLQLISGGALNIAANILDASVEADQSTDIQLQADSDLSIADGVLVDAGAGQIQVTSNNGDVIVTGLRTASTAASAVEIIAGGAILDAGDSALDILVGDGINSGELSLSAQSGIANLEVDAANYRVSNGAASALVLSDPNDMNLLALSTLGDANLSAIGDLNLSPTSSISASNLSLQAATITLADQGLTVAGNLSLVASNGLSNGQSAQPIILSASDLFLDLGSQSAAQLQTQVGSLSLNYHGNNDLNLSNSQHLTVDQLSLSAGGNVVLSTAADRDLSINASDLNGHSGDLNLQAGRNLTLLGSLENLSLGADNSGDLSLSAANNLTMAGATRLHSGAGRLSLNAGSDLQLAQLQSNSSAADAIVLTAQRILAGTELVSAVNGGLSIASTFAGSSLAPLLSNVALLNFNGAAPNAELYLNNASALQVDTLANLNRLDLNVASGDLSFLQSSAGIASSADINVADGNWVISDDGWQIGGNLQVQANGIVDSDNQVSLSAAAADFNLSNATADTTINSNFDRLSLNFNGANIDVIDADDLVVDQLVTSADAYVAARDGTLDVSGLSPTVAGDLSLATLNSGDIVLADSGISHLGNLSLLTDQLRDSDFDLSINAAALDVHLRNQNTSALWQTNLSDLSLQQQGSGAIEIENAQTLNVIALDSAADITLQSDGDLNLNSVAAAQNLSLSTLNNGVVRVANGGVSIAGDWLIDAADLQSSNAGQPVQISGTSADIQIRQNLSALDLVAEVDDLALTTASDQATNISTSQNLNLQSIASAGVVNVTSSGALLSLGFSSADLSALNIDGIQGQVRLADSGLANSGALSIRTQDMSLGDGRRDLNLAASSLDVNLLNVQGDHQWQLQTGGLSAVFFGSGDLNINASQSLSIRDTLDRGYAVRLSDGAFSLNQSSGDISVDGVIQASDGGDNGQASGQISLRNSDGDINVNAPLFSLNTLDSAGSNTASVTLQLTDNAAATANILLNAQILAEGGDVLLDAGAGAVVETDAAQISAYNDINDELTGLVAYNGIVLPAAANQSIGVGRRLNILDGRTVEPPQDEVDVDDALEQIDDDLPLEEPVADSDKNGAQADLVYEQAFGRCNEVELEQGNNCRVDTALKAFLSHWLVGGEMPPKSEIPR